MQNEFNQSLKHQVAGLEWCSDLAKEIEDSLDEIPVLEIIPENFMKLFGFSIPKKFFEEIEKREIPVLVHCVGLSIATIEPFKDDYFRQVLEVVERLPTTISVSDHLCMTEKDGSEIGQLTTTTYNQKTLDSVKRKIEIIQKRINVPFVLENITHCFTIPNQQYSETAFFNELFASTGIKLLLDLNNLYTNGVNFAIDPYQWLWEVDPDNIDSIHLAGGYLDKDNMLMDGHCANVPQGVWELFEHVIKTAGRPITSIVERTANNSEFGLKPILEDQKKAQAIMDRLATSQTASRVSNFSSYGLQEARV